MTTTNLQTDKSAAGRHEPATVTDQIIARRDDILRIATKHGARNVRVFGSVARGEAGPDSDLDLLVDVEAVHSPFFPGGLREDLAELLGRNVDVVTAEALHWFLRDRVLREAVPL